MSLYNKMYLKRRNWRMHCCCCQGKIKMNIDQAHQTWITCPHCGRDIYLVPPHLSSIDEQIAASYYYPHKRNYVKYLKSIKRIVDNIEK